MNSILMFIAASVFVGLLIYLAWDGWKELQRE